LTPTTRGRHRDAKVSNDGNNYNELYVTESEPLLFNIGYESNPVIKALVEATYRFSLLKIKDDKNWLKNTQVKPLFFKQLIKNLFSPGLKTL